VKAKSLPPKAPRVRAVLRWFLAAINRIGLDMRTHRKRWKMRPRLLGPIGPIGPSRPIRRRASRLAKCERQFRRAFNETTDDVLCQLSVVRPRKRRMMRLSIRLMTNDE
jgi:hypothetical protein